MQENLDFAISNSFQNEIPQVAAGRVPRSPNNRFVARGGRAGLPHLLLSCVFAGLLTGSFSQQAAAQAAAETAVITSKMSKVGAKAKPPSFPVPKTAQAKSAKADSSPHLPPREGEPMDVVNRRELEANAGEDAGTALIRSEPAKAEIWFGEKLVGETPLLLVLAPGNYEVELRRDGYFPAELQVDLLPKEAREFVHKLKSRYPARVVIRPRP